MSQSQKCRSLLGPGGSPLFFAFLFRRVAVRGVEKEKSLFEVFDEGSDDWQLFFGFLKWSGQIREEMRADAGRTGATVERCPDLAVVIVIQLNRSVGARCGFQEVQRDKNGAAQVAGFAAALAPEYSARD